MFTKLEQNSWIKIWSGTRSQNRIFFQELCEACGNATLPYLTVARWIKEFREIRAAIQDNLRTGRPHVENNTVQLLASLLDADRRWTARELAAEVWVYHKTVLHILYDILGYRKLAIRWIPHEISEMQQWHRYAIAHFLLDRYQREGDDFLGRIVAIEETWDRSYERILKRQLNEWKHHDYSSSKESATYTMCCEGNVHCGVWHWRGNIAPRCTSKADCKLCLLLHVPAAPPSSSAQEKTTTLGGNELHHSSWQFKESRRCFCHGPLAPISMGDSGTSTILTRYDSMQLQSLRQSVRTTAREPVQHKIWIYPCCSVVTTEHQQRWTWWRCTTPSKHLAKGDK